MQNKNKIQQGFTLIELLVVIAIIGLLASIVITAVAIARKRARDTRRVADIHQMSTAIEAYTTANGHVPYMGTYDCQASQWQSHYADCYTTDETSQAWKVGLQSDLSTYLAKLPTDPCGVNCGNGSTILYRYVYMSPANISHRCHQSGAPCRNTDNLVNSQYEILAENMEVASPNYTKYYGNATTYGISNTSLGGQSF